MALLSLSCQVYSSIIISLINTAFQNSYVMYLVTLKVKAVWCVSVCVCVVVRIEYGRWEVGDAIPLMWMYVRMHVDALHIHFPSVCFMPPPLSNTVYADGSICLDILQNRWSPTYDVSAILTSIQVHILRAEFISLDVGR